MAVDIFKLLEQSTRGYWVCGRPKAGCTGVHYDTRKLSKNQLFVALKTETNDGHYYLEKAASMGASAAIVSCARENIGLSQWVVEDTRKAFEILARAYRDSFEGIIVGITGSHGKTSTKDLLYILLAREETLKTQDNLNNTLGVPYTLMQLDNSRHRFAVIEAGMNRPGEMECIAQIMRPDHAIVTMVSHQHLEYVGNIEAVAYEKSCLPASLRPGGNLWCPESCMEYAAFRKIKNPVQCITQDIDKASNMHYYRVEKKGSVLTVYFLGEYWELPRMSQGMVSNSVLAIGVAMQLGIEKRLIQERLSSWTPSEKRGEWKVYGNQTYYVDCYNSGPAALQNALDYFETEVDDMLKRMYVIGPMNELGEASDTLHYQAAKYINARQSDMIVVIHPKARCLVDGLLDKGVRSENIYYFEECLDAKAMIRLFEGAIFLKGSQSYALQRLLPESIH